MPLFVGDFRLEEGPQFPAIRSGQLGRVVDVHQNGLILPGQVLVEAINQNLSIRGRFHGRFGAVGGNWFFIAKSFRSHISILLVDK